MGTTPVSVGPGNSPHTVVAGSYGEESVAVVAPSHVATVHVTENVAAPRRHSDAVDVLESLKDRGSEVLASDPDAVPIDAVSVRPGFVARSGGVGR